MQRILVLGAGFAGLWAALAAARKLAGAARSDAVEILVINARPFHSIRVRNYEADLEVTKVPLADVLDPVGATWRVGSVTAIDTAAQQVSVTTSDETLRLDYDRLLIALGSHLVHADIPGLADYSFNIDTIEGAERLRAHLDALPLQPDSQGRYRAIVIGAGLTGSEIAAELPRRLAAVADAGSAVGVTLIDRTQRVASAMGEAQPVIETAMQALGVELRPGVNVKRVTADGIELDSGEWMAASTVIWCGGMRANAINRQLGVELDALGRLPVDNCLRVNGLAHVYAAGDAANFLIDGKNDCVMSCQYGRPMGRYAGHNMAADLLGEALLPLSIDWYTTIADLGPWGAVYTETRERKLVASGAQAKRTKQLINGERIYPPLNRDRTALLEAAAPALQSPPPDKPENAAAPPSN